MYSKQRAGREVVQALKKAIGKSFIVTPDMLETPPEDGMGDLAFPCFELAKGEGRNPVEIATEIAAKIGAGEFIEKTQALGPYVNFFFSSNTYGKSILDEIVEKGEKYGDSTTGEGVKVIIDYAQPNTHKTFHVGHLRNAVYGQSVVNVLNRAGYSVIPAAYLGDIGAHVAKSIWCMQKFHDGEEIAKEDRASRLQGIYEEATRKIEENEDLKEEVAEVQRKLEAKEEPLYSLWKETREWSIDSFKKIFEILNIKPDVYYYESEVEEPGKKLVQKLLTDGIAKKSEGAIIVDLEAEDLGIFLLLKSDGSSLYATKDLALAYKKMEDFKPDRQIFIVDVRQSLYFKQLFATLRRIGFDGELVHLSYDMVTLKEGAMSSRKGNVVTFDQLYTEMTESFIKETKERHIDWKEEKIQETAKALALASMQFMMLRQDADSILTFDMEEAMSFDGFTAPYIMYTIARIERILGESPKKPKLNIDLLSNPLEVELMKKLGDYPGVVDKTAQSFHVSSIATWTFETSQLFAEYYHAVKILNKEDEAQESRVILIAAVKEVLTNALNILGIKVLKEM